ncbi:MAG: MFS transporter [Opitutaceae bacterium]|nr:MFS transporter [Opitutaceae bacterium]
MVCYFFAFISRVNAGVAALQMNKDLGLSPAAFGLGASLFFVSYTAFGIPCNMAMVRFGARLWLTLTIIALSLTSLAMAFITGPNSFYVARFLLGVAEAGFFPGAILYLTYWFPRSYRARIIAIFMAAIPVSSLLGSPVSAALLGLEGLWGLHGWQWMFILEGLPIVLLGVLAFYILPDNPTQAKWLRPEQVSWLTGCLAEERAKVHKVSHIPVWKVLINGPVLILSIAYAASSAVSNSLSLWQPQIIKSFGLSDMQTGVLNAIPFGLGLGSMLLWGRFSDKTGERLLSTSLPLLLCALALGLTLVTDSLVLTMVILCVALVGIYAIKGPFWALAADLMSSEVAPTGIAAINTLAHVATFGAIYLLGIIKSSTGSFPVALLPLVLLNVVGGVGLLIVAHNKKKGADAGNPAKS